MNTTMAECRAVQRLDFVSFIQRSLHELSPTTAFHPSRHIEVIASELEACRSGETKRLIINLRRVG